jgi:two-component system, OmpR family, sensor histidine kinase BaeS
MSRSITLRLVLAFLLVGITVVAMASGITYWLTVREFKQLTYNQARDRFVSDMTFFYQTRGSWDGVLEYYQQRNAVHTPLSPEPQRPPGGQDAGHQPQTLFFALADPNGNILIPASDYRQGNRVPKSVLSEGTAVTVNNERVGTVLVVGSPPPLGPLEASYLNRTNMGLLLAALGASAVALVLGIVLARALTQPIRALTTAIRAMAAGDLKQNVEVRSKDELGELAAAFNQMSAELDRLLRARRQMTADIAHDLRNPLTVIGGYIESIHDGVLKPTPERLDAIQAEVQHLERLVEDLRTLSQADAGELTLNREPVSVPALLERAAQSYRPLAEKQGIHLRIETGPGLPEVQADPNRLARVLGNLISNSLRYTPPGGEIVLKAARQGTKQVRLSVSDNGKGIQPNALPYIFDRLYRADPARSHSEESGLGLAIARSIVEAHGGTIAAESVPGKGTAMTIVLPV